MRYYIEFNHAPQYAVLLKGAWGIGKTFLVRKILDAHHAGSEKKYIYISLYGSSSYEDIDRSLQNAIYPVLDSKAAVVGTKLAKAALGFFKIKTDISIGDFTNKFKDALYVFDDLERCALPIQKVMGYINEFVEHDSCKVVIIANEGAIKEKEDYYERREKTIGKVLEVQPSMQEAFSFFLSKVEDERSRKFLQLWESQIVGLFESSGLNNLRILQQTLWDFERLCKLINPQYCKNEAGMKALVNLFFPLSFDVKSGKLNEKDICSRYDYQWASFFEKSDNKEAPTRMEQSISKYRGSDLTDGILSNALLVDILFKGLLNAEEINQTIGTSHHYQKSHEQEPWRVVWHFLDVSGDELSKSLIKMEEQFKNHEFTAPGDVLHVFGLRLWAASEKLLPVSRRKIYSQNKAYVDYLYHQGKLNKLKPESNFSDSDEFGGLGVREAKSVDFGELAAYLSKKRAQAQLDQHPAWGREILIDMKNNSDIFSKVALRSGESNPYYRIPILATINPKEFVQTWLSMNPIAQRNIAVALDGRYNYGALKSELKNEYSWLKNVQKEIKKQLKNFPRPSQVRFNWICNTIVDKYLLKQSKEVAETDGE